MKKQVAVPIRRADEAAPPGLATAAAVILGITLLLGGAGDSYPWITLLLELGALGLLWYILASRGLSGLRRVSVLPSIVVAGAILVPLVQLIPLPPSLWQQLPGRELPLELLRLTALTEGWRPISLDPGATVRTALEMLPGLAMLLAVVHLRPEDRLRLVHVAIAVGTMSAILGAFQRAAGALSPLIIFETPHSGNSPGLFVNRNHQATFLLVTMLLTAGMGRRLFRPLLSPELTRIAAAGLIALFAAGVVVTTSRTGLLLLAPTAAASLLLLFPVRWSWKSSAAVIAAILAFAAAASQLAAVQDTLQRFRGFQDERTIYWSDTVRAIEQHWPIGSGLGTFAGVHAAAQSLESVGIQYVNNAHNDYLELALEGGLAAVSLIFLVVICIVIGAIRLWRASRAGAGTALPVAALGGIGLILLHSLLDYPLRMLSLMAVFGLLWGLVLTATHKEPAR